MLKNRMVNFKAMYKWAWVLNTTLVQPQQESCHVALWDQSLLVG